MWQKGIKSDTRPLIKNSNVLNTISSVVYEHHVLARCDPPLHGSQANRETRSSWCSGAVSKVTLKVMGACWFSMLFLGSLGKRQEVHSWLFGVKGPWRLLEWKEGAFIVWVVFG